VWTPPNRLLAARIAGQFGLVTRSQALGAGVTRKAVACHLDSGRWIVVHPGVYLTTPGRSDWSVRAMSALLWAGAGAVLYRVSAGYAWGLVRAEPEVIEVAVPYPRLVTSRELIAVTRSRTSPARLDPLAWPHRISAPHTALDLSSGHDIDRAVTLAARALDLRLCTSGQLVAALSLRPKQPHRALLLEALTDVGDGSESAAELRYVRDVERAHGLPRGRRQAPVGDGRRRDIEYEEFGVVVEIDGRLGHVGWTNRQRDGRRDREAAADGRLTIRVFWPDLLPPCALAGEVGTILRTRGWTGWPQRCGPHCGLREGSVPLWGP